jgi:predicted nucleotidyltransferase
MRTNSTSPSFDLDEVRRIVRARLQGQEARVYLFGSWATGRNGRTSDIDVAILPAKALPEDLLSELREALEESLVVYPVDVVDLSTVPAEFRSRVLKEGILWDD